VFNIYGDVDAPAAFNHVVAATRTTNDAPTAFYYVVAATRAIKHNTNDNTFFCIVATARAAKHIANP
jgi:hypothetical protein